ncbi:MAG: ribosomal protein L11 methyltransferase [Candidatus Epulonipiscioides saccharophilum]|nr:MAG: ribosomal protein L11 methyltransferase [Epulopiscium sp. AS2M-Bin001]
MDYIEFKIETTTEAVEAISYFLSDDLEAGVEICDPKDALNQDKTQTWYDFIDQSLLDQDMDTVYVKAYFNKGIDITEHKKIIENKLQHISEFLNVGSAKVTVTEIPEEKWANEWKKYYKVFNITNNVIIKPSWIDHEKEENMITIEMDPGMAFGSGTHETTSMCAILLEQYIKFGDHVLDVGTGSGILAIIAAKMGGDVLAIDIDPMAIKVAKENVENNKVDVILKEGNLLEVVESKADIVVSNIIADIIISLADQVKRMIKFDGVWIASGIIDTRKDEVVDAIIKNGWEIIDIVAKNEWIALAMRAGQ